MFNIWGVKSARIIALIVYVAGIEPIDTRSFVQYSSLLREF